MERNTLSIFVIISPFRSHVEYKLTIVRARARGTRRARHDEISRSHNGERCPHARARARAVIRKLNAVVCVRASQSVYRRLQADTARSPPHAWTHTRARAHTSARSANRSGRVEGGSGRFQMPPRSFRYTTTVIKNLEWRGAKLLAFAFITAFNHLPFKTSS